MEHSNIRPNEKRAKNAIYLIWAVVVLHAVVLTLNLFFFISHEQYESLIDNEYYADDLSLDIIGVLIDTSNIILISVCIMSVATFIMWFHRAYSNLHEKVATLRYNKDWCIAAWFIPIYNLYVPYKIMRELYIETNTLFSQSLRTCTISLKTNLLLVWWILFIVCLIIKRIYFDTALLHIISPFLLMIFTLILILITVLAFITTKIIKEYNEVEPLLNEIDDEENEAYTI